MDDFIAFLQHFLGVSLNDDGTLRLGDKSVTKQIEGTEGHWWKKGPWIFDTPTKHDAFITAPASIAGTYNDYAPAGVDTAIGIEINPAGNIALTGLKAPVGNYRRLVVLRNMHATNTITLKHQNTGSAELNRFSLPGNVDLVMGALQTTWLYYDNVNCRWVCFITGNTSGGLSGPVTTGIGDVVGPAGVAADNNLAVFSGTTGKLLKDGGPLGTLVASLHGSFLYQASRVITDVEHKALNAAPMLIVPGVSESILLPLGFVVVTYNCTVAWTNARSVVVRYVGTTDNWSGGVTISTAATGLKTFSAQLLQPATLTGDYRGVGIEIFNTSTTSGPNGTTTGGTKIVFNYVAVPMANQS